MTFLRHFGLTGCSLNVRDIFFNNAKVKSNGLVAIFLALELR